VAEEWRLSTIGISHHSLQASNAAIRYPIWSAWKSTMPTNNMIGELESPTPSTKPYSQNAPLPMRELHTMLPPEVIHPEMDSKAKSAQQDEE
jgi:hypothetical protein